jgi:hypothetical protein
MLLRFAAIAVFGIVGATRHGRRIPPCLPELGFHMADDPDGPGVKTVTRPQKFSVGQKYFASRSTVDSLPRRSTLSASHLPALARPTS